MDACCSISLAAPECAPSAPTSSGEEPVQSYRFKSRKGYSLQVRPIVAPTTVSVDIHQCFLPLAKAFAVSLLVGLD